MTIRVGDIQALYRYPVKSMRGESIATAELCWHGLVGDRRLSLRRLGDQGGFPWLTASKLPELLLYTPIQAESSEGSPLPTHVRTPAGEELPIFGEELAAEIGERHGTPVEMTHLDRGIFDEASVSAITSATVEEIARLSGHSADVRRFRPNIQIRSEEGRPFADDDWVGGVLSFGEGENAPAIAVTNWDQRCAMVNFDPDSARRNPEVLESVVRERSNNAGVYGAVIRRGRLEVGQPVYFTPDPAR